ncbi:Uncharacterised protein [Candidatus Burarchaeum australiense]|nr:Uncharacterised protein [Candidatus Burarchaeum australiense]
MGNLGVTNYPDEELRSTDISGRWLYDARIELKTNFVNYLEAGMRKFDPNFSFTPQERQGLQKIIDEILDPASGRITLIEDKPPKFSGCYYPSERRIELNSAAFKNSTDLMNVLTHELFHYISYAGWPSTVFGDKRPSFSEGAGDFLAALITVQCSEFQGGKYSRLLAEGYSVENFAVYALLKSGRVKPHALLEALLGSAYQGEFADGGNPEAEFVRQVESGARPGIVDELFPESGEYMTPTLGRRADEDGFVRSRAAIFDLLAELGIDVDGMATEAHEDLQVDLFNWAW